MLPKNPIARNVGYSCSQMTWGSARVHLRRICDLHPRLYAITRFAGYSRESTKSPKNESP